MRFGPKNKLFQLLKEQIGSGRQRMNTNGSGDLQSDLLLIAFSFLASFFPTHPIYLWASLSQEQGLNANNLAAEASSQPCSGLWLMASGPPRPVFFPGSCPRCAGLCPAGWPWAWGLWGKHPSPPPSHAWDRPVPCCADRAPAFTTEKETLSCKEPLLFLSPSLASSLVAVGCQQSTLCPTRVPF